MMASYNIFLLPGDGIGPEVTAEVEKVAKVISDAGLASFEFEKGLVGGSAYDAHGKAISDADVERAGAADAVLLAAVGGPKWAGVPYDVRPEAGLLRLRKDFSLYANLRPAQCYPALADSSSLKREVVEGLDILILRELTGDLYFGEPRGISVNAKGEREAVNTMRYTEGEIERIAHVAFQAARRRRGKVCSVDKANVLEVMQLWREVVARVGRDYPDVELSHMFVDAAVMALMKAPKAFDVIVTGNVFGDILSDGAAMLTGSIGMLPTASLGVGRKGLYEPVHGSAPDIAGKGVANPLAAILSAEMMLRHSFDQAEAADRINRAVKRALADGLRTPDIWSPGCRKVSTTEMGDAVAAAIGV
jgi:3-isopropylmalate dehydrogenase